MSARRGRPRHARDRSSTTISIACLAVLLSCGGEPTTGGEATTPPVPPPVTPVAQPERPLSGAAVPGMASYDRTIADFMRKHAIPGGAVAVVRDGKLVYALGLFNTRSLTANLEAELDAALWSAHAGVTSFPTHDLFSTFR